MCVRLTQEEIVITCRDTATATAVGFVEGPAPTALTLRDGDLEIAIEGLTTHARPDVPWTDVDAGLLAGPTQSMGATLPVQEAEWAPLDENAAPHDTVRHDRPQVLHVASASRSPRARPGDFGDAPTRIQRLEEVLGESEFAPRGAPDARSVPPRRPEDGSTARTVVAPRGRLSKGVRRFALLGMLACALMLWLRARRAHEVARAPRETTPQALERPPAAPADSASPHATGALPLPNRTAPAPRAPPSKGSLTKARRAADALAEGDYTQALELYKGLATDEANPAYARIVDSLRSRFPTSP